MHKSICKVRILRIHVRSKRHCSVTLSTSLCDAEVMRDWTLSVGITLQPQEMSIIYLLQHSVLKKKYWTTSAFYIRRLVFVVFASWFIFARASIFVITIVFAILCIFPGFYLIYCPCFQAMLFILLVNSIPSFMVAERQWKKNIWDEDVSL